MTVRKILIVGVLDVPSSTNVAMKKGFEKLGYTVDAYNYRTVIKQLGSVELMWEDFGKFIIKQKYHLIVFCKVNGMHPSLLHYAKKAGPTWYWFMDNLEMAKKIDAAALASNATLASATSSNVWDRFFVINKNAHVMIEGVDPDTYYYEELKKIHDILFIGHATPERIKEFQRLTVLAAHRKFVIFGEGWSEINHLSNVQVNPPVFGEDERIEINQADFVLNLVHDKFIFSDRVTKALACGASIISQYSKDLDMTFGEFIFLYNSYESFDMIARTKSPLVSGEKSAQLSKVIAKLYSWEAVCGRMLEVVDDCKEAQNLR
jgi:hypothetical protein